jgi:hypothetical protein
MANARFPKMTESGLIEKMLLFNEKRDRQKIIDNQIYPEQSPTYLLKNLIKTYGNRLYPENMSPEERDQLYKEHINQRQLDFKEIEDELAQREKDWVDEKLKIN